MGNLNEQEMEKIRSQAKSILETFSRSLDSIEIKKKEFKKRQGGFREEGQALKGCADFRVRMFENAPLKNEDHIIAEKKKW